MIYRISRFFALLFYNIFYPHKVYGKENLIKEGKSVVVCNHYAKIDALFLADLYKDKTYFLGKKEWFTNKFLNYIFRKYGGIPVDRENIDFISMKSCLKVLKDNKRLMIFPEGTRNRTGNEDLLPIKGGAGLIAFKGKAEIVPIAMMSRFKMFTKNYAIVGKTISLEQFMDRKYSPELNDEIAKIIENAISGLRLELIKLVEENKKQKGKK